MTFVVAAAMQIVRPIMPACTLAGDPTPVRPRIAGAVLPSAPPALDHQGARSLFSTVKSALADQSARHADAKMELFDYTEVFYNQKRRHSTLGRISPAACY